MASWDRVAAQDAELSRRRRRRVIRNRWIVAVLVVLVPVLAVGAYLYYPALFTPPAVTADTVALEAGVPAEAIAGTVIRVHDGDTLHIRTSASDDVTVRLIGIDTPEVGENLECYGDEATELARKLMPEGSTVWALADGGTHDKYGRALYYLFTDEGLLVNEALVAQGAAETLLISNNDRYWPELEAAEAEARDEGRGVWGAC
jgi:micrococcal nuclease